MSNWKKKAFLDLALNAVKAHGKELLKAEPSDGEDFGLPKKADRPRFYAELLGALSVFESNQDPTVEYEENFNDSNGKKVISRGLLQISIESANGYGAGIKDEKDLHDPAINLKAGVLIMSRWIVKDGLITNTKSEWRGMARYWSPFRDAKKRTAIKEATKAEMAPSLVKDEAKAEKERLVAASAAVPGRTLKKGHRGDDVSEMQKALAAAGFNPGRIDGVFGDKTDAAVRSFQAQRQLKVDGAVGPKTRAALSLGDIFETAKITSICPPYRPKFTAAELDSFCKALKFADAPVKILGIRGHYRDSMGKVGKNDRRIYDDAIVVILDDGTYHTYNANTDPSGRRPGHGTGKYKGMATLVEGLWSGVYTMRKHKQQYDALCQDGGPVTVRRDADDSVPNSNIVKVNGEKFYLHTGMFGINIHRGASNSTSSEGCQTIYPPQWDEFQKLVYKVMKSKKMKTVEYGLVSI